MTRVGAVILARHGESEQSATGRVLADGRPFDEYRPWAGARDPTEAPSGGESRAEVAAR